MVFLMNVRPIAITLVREKPLATIELLVHGAEQWPELRLILESLADRMEWSRCRLCGGSIHLAPGQKNWMHDADNMRGCRAASFSPEAGWDDEIPQSWKATPTKESP